MNELLKLIGFRYLVIRQVVSVPDDINVIKKTNYAYHMQCKIGIGYKKERGYKMDDDTWDKYLWKCNLSYLGEK